MNRDKLEQFQTLRSKTKAFLPLADVVASLKTADRSTQQKSTDTTLKQSRHISVALNFNVSLGHIIYLYIKV